jgi:VanZ family protein
VPPPADSDLRRQNTLPPFRYTTTLASTERAAERLPISQKVLHFCGYSWLALLAFLTIKRRSLAVMLALSMILLGIALEFGQKLVPGRAFEIRDMFINGFGVLTGIVIGILSRRGQDCRRAAGVRSAQQQRECARAL